MILGTRDLGLSSVCDEYEEVVYSSKLKALGGVHRDFILENKMRMPQM